MLLIGSTPCDDSGDELDDNKIVSLTVAELKSLVDFVYTGRIFRYMPLRHRDRLDRALKVTSAAKLTSLISTQFAATHPGCVSAALQWRRMHLLEQQEGFLTMPGGPLPGVVSIMCGYLGVPPGDKEDSLNVQRMLPSGAMTVWSAFFFEYCHRLTVKSKGRPLPMSPKVLHTKPILYEPLYLTMSVDSKGYGRMTMQRSGLCKLDPTGLPIWPTEWLRCSTIVRLTSLEREKVADNVIMEFSKEFAPTSNLFRHVPITRADVELIIQLQLETNMDEKGHGLQDIPEPIVGGAGGLPVATVDALEQWFPAYAKTLLDQIHFVKVIRHVEMLLLNALRTKLSRSGSDDSPRKSWRHA